MYPENNPVKFGMLEAWRVSDLGSHCQKGARKWIGSTMYALLCSKATACEVLLQPHVAISCVILLTFLKAFIFVSAPECRDKETALNDCTYVHMLILSVCL